MAAAPEGLSLAELSEGGHLLVWGARHWMLANIRGERVPLSVLRSFETFGEPSVFGQIALLLLALSRAADRPLAIQPPCLHQLSADEQSLARAVEAATDGSEVNRHLQPLIGSEPSVELLRSLTVVARQFQDGGVAVAIAPVGSPTSRTATC